MKTSALMKTGATGVIFSALCCFTPVMTLFLGAVGMVAWVGYLDYILMPALLFFVGLIIYAVTRKPETTCAENGGCQTSKRQES